jgi:excisionase family DNA binding protein
MVTKQFNASRKRKLQGQTSITVESIASYCMVSRTTVGRWIKDGRLSAMKLPSGQFRVSVSDFKSFLERHKMPIRQELLDIES